MQEQNIGMFPGSPAGSLMRIPEDTINLVILLQSTKALFLEVPSAAFLAIYTD